MARKALVLTVTATGMPTIGTSTFAAAAPADKPLFHTPLVSNVNVPRQNVAPTGNVNVGNGNNADQGNVDSNGNSNDGSGNTVDGGNSGGVGNRRGMTFGA
ncbi:hypothetical protein [Kutzneria kofuensis]|uniref:Uncharacterized protein n=1 Tax=Kutzneria kofuensis TaxID=103725 RepID=A0A7W9NFQ7_9PSEU|nr:hypothetical protein [Kutzneria kofuensis]MBB5891667.1 hypothetical protein [Kutzneria kofuensis]